ncbi:MAG: MATE family efflux transporter [Holosporaceae bacterium]|jgi:MATE family multidrug resistance protein|nr:MATE family efflux transporter [Holosporaceae bacterium]
MDSAIADHKIIDCTLKSIFRVSVPIMISMASVLLMLLIDRAMLAAYSMDSMNAAIMSGNFVCIFCFMFMGVANSAEIFVGQYNGSKQYEKLATPTWQMIYMSLATYVISFPVAYFSDHINTLPHYYLKEGIAYQQTLMYFAFIPPLRVALVAFFVGQGKTKIITFAVTAGVILDIVLDYLLIYGVKNIIPAMGCRGAAIATIIAEFVQVTILAMVFFSRKNRRIYKTFQNRRFNAKLFMDCIRIGVPMSLSNCISMIAWYVVQTAVSYTSKDSATIYNIGNSVYMLFLFVGEGANKAIAAISANMIGRGDLESIEKTRRIFVAISFIFGGIIAVPHVLCPEWIFIALELFPGNITHLYADMRAVFYLVALDVVLETLLLSHWGILIAGGDTKYAATIYQICLWVFVVLPTLILYYLKALTSMPLLFVLMGLWLIAAQFFLYKRYKSLKWYNKLV